MNFPRSQSPIRLWYLLKGVLLPKSLKYVFPLPIELLTANVLNLGGGGDVMATVTALF